MKIDTYYIWVAVGIAALIAISILFPGGECPPGTTDYAPGTAFGGCN